MAEINISIAEIVDLLIQNNVLKNFVFDIRFEGDYITFNFHTGQFFPRHIPVSLKFENFESEKIVFEVSTNWMSDQFLKLLPIKNNRFLKLKFPKLEVNIQKISESFLEGLLFKKIDYVNGLYQIKFQTKED